MNKCENCDGKGLVSTGANKLDLGTGRSETCSVCAGTGKTNTDAVSSGTQTGDNLDPKEEGSSSQSGDGSEHGEPSGISPKDGDKCRTDDDRAGTLHREGDRWVCVANEE